MKRHVLLVESVGDVGGAERVLLDTLRLLDRDRWEASLLVLSIPGAFSREAAPHAAIAHHPTGRYRDPRAIGSAVLRCAREVRRSGAEVVHANGAKAHIVAGLAALLCRKPCIWHVHEILDPRSPLNLLALRVPTARYLATSRAVRQQLLRLGAPASQVRVVYPGLDVARFQESLPRAGEAGIRAELGVAPDVPLITMVGRLQPGKGQHVLLGAAPYVLARFPTAQFLIVGDALFGLDGDYPARLRRLTARLVLDQSVHFLGQRTDVPAILHASTVAVQAAVSPEAFGLATLEGMAAGKPVVASRLGGVGEIITDGVTGILVRPGQPAVLGRCIVDLLANPERRAALAAAAAARTVDFTAAETARGVQAAWDDVAARSRSHAMSDRPSRQACPRRGERLAPERAR